MELLDLMRIEDALESIGEKRCIFTRESFVGIHKVSCQALAGQAWDRAADLVTKHGTVRKAINAIRREIAAAA